MIYRLLHVHVLTMRIRFTPKRFRVRRFKFVLDAPFFWMSSAAAYHFGDGPGSLRHASPFKLTIEIDGVPGFMVTTPAHYLGTYQTPFENVIPVRIEAGSEIRITATADPNFPGASWNEVGLHGFLEKDVPEGSKKRSPQLAESHGRGKRLKHRSIT